VVQVRTVEGVVKSSKRFVVAVMLGLACLVVMGVLSSPASASWADKVKAAKIRSNIHTLQIAVQSYLVDHDDLWPPEASGREFRAMLRPYIDGPWPTNPYTGKPMRQKSTAGNFTYSTYAHRTSYRMIGWGRHGHRIIVVP
jgi:hypothetical protein